MIFTGTGIVKRRGRTIANFADGTAAVDDPGAILCLKALGFREAASAGPPAQAHPPKEKTAARAPSPKKGTK